MKLFTRKGIVTLGATVAIATTGIVAPAQAEETTPTEVTTSNSAPATLSEKESPAPTEGNGDDGKAEETEAPAPEAVSSSEYDCHAEAAKEKPNTGIMNSLKCQVEVGGFEKQLGIITGFATLVTTVIGVASAVFSLVKKVAPELF